MSIKALYPNTFPSTQIDFSNKSFLPPEVEFSRGSTGTYVDENGIIRTALPGEPRFTYDPITGEGLGLLVEEQRTNNVTYSATQADYSLQGTGTAAPSSTVAPDSTTNTCIRVQGLALNDGISKATLISTTGDYFPTVYARSRTGASQDVKVTQSGGVGPTITLPADGSWIRVTGQVATLGSGNRDIRILQATANPIDIDVWGFQTELGAFPTSYIPTTGTPGGETRNADEASIVGTDFSSWYNQSEGTYYAQASKLGTNPLVQQTILTTGGNTRYPEFTFRPAGESIPGAAAIYGNNLSLKSTGALDSAKFAAAYADGVGTTSVINNTYQGSSVNDPITTQRTNIIVGNWSSGAFFLNGHIARLTYWPKRLPDGALQFITS